MDSYFCSGCFIKRVKYSDFDYSNSDNLIDVTISFDYLEYKKFPELLSIYRNFKLDSIL